MFLLKQRCIFSIYVLLICFNAKAQINLHQSSFSHTGIAAPASLAAMQENDGLYNWCNYLLHQNPFANPNTLNALTQIQLGTLQKICDLQLQRNTVEQLPITTQALTQQFYFVQANAHFKNKEFLKAIEAYKKVNTSELSNLQIVEKNFNLAYSYLSTNQEKEVIPLMASVVNIKGNYFESGNYYYGLLKFYNNDFDEALASFEKIKTDKEFKKVVPYYLASIYYFKNDKPKSLEIANQYLQDNDAKLYFREELNLLAGKIHFEDKQFETAIPYIENYIADASNIRREDLFLLGFSHYQVGNIKKAQSVFSRITEDLDTISQMTNYVLGDCYLKQGKKEEAKDAFQKVLNIDGIAQINEISRFHFASLSYEMNIDDEALNAAYNLVKKFPNSTYKKDCIRMIGNLLSTTSNYASALQILRELNEESETKSAYQQIAFNQASTELKKNNLDNALKLFAESDEHNADENIFQWSNFWKSEIYFRQKKYELATEFADVFIKNASKNKGEASKNNAYLIKTYIAIKNGDDSSATKYLNKILVSKDDNYLMKNAIELNKITKTLDNFAAIQTNNTKYIDYVTQLIENNNKDAATAILRLDTLQNLKPAQAQKIAETKAIYQSMMGNHLQAFQLLNNINQTSNMRLYFYTLQSAIALKDTIYIANTTSTLLQNIDTTNEWQAKIIVQQFDNAIDTKDTIKAIRYLEMLGKYISPYAKARVPIKQKVLKAMQTNTLPIRKTEEEKKPITPETINPKPVATDTNKVIKNIEKTLPKNTVTVPKDKPKTKSLKPKQ
jgi:tetratricopeptide (TPR) repeat protein